MAKQMIVEGQTAKNPTTGQRIIYRSGKWYDVNQDPQAGRTDGDAPIAPLTPGSESRTRLAAGLGPSIVAQQNMYKAEGWNQDPNSPAGHNPYNTFRGTVGSVAEAVPYDGGATARIAGGEKYQEYQQASKSFESAFLPILSGAAVTPTEAQRMIRASLPLFGDSPQILARKATNRAMMINAAADLMGRPRPFPKVGIMPGFGGSQSVPAGRTPPAAPAQGQGQGQDWKFVSAE